MNTQQPAGYGQPTTYVPRTILVSPIFGTGPRYKPEPRRHEPKDPADKVSFAGVGFIFGAAQPAAAREALDPQDERVHQMLSRLTLREHGFLLAHVNGVSYGAMARASGLARSTATIAVQRVCEKLEEESPESLRARWQPAIDAIEYSEYNRLYGIPKNWWNLNDPEVGNLMRPHASASNQHLKRYAAARNTLRAKELKHG